LKVVVLVLEVDDKVEDRTFV